jgi:hypothetical protein
LLAEKVRLFLTCSCIYADAIHRTPSCGMVVSIPWHSHTLEPPTTTLFANSCTLPYQTSPTMSVVRL